MDINKNRIYQFVKNEMHNNKNDCGTFNTLAEVLESVRRLQIAFQLTNLHTGSKTSKSEITVLRCDNALRMIP